jgi:hypothetical protein
MIHWLYPANVKFYDVLSAFNAPETYWPINSKVSIEDVIYIYLAAPYKQIGFVCDVAQVNFELSDVIEKVRPFFKGKNNDAKKSKLFMKLRTSSVITLESCSTLSYEHLKQNGLAGMLMGPRKLENNPALLEYIKRSLQ